MDSAHPRFGLAAALLFFAVLIFLTQYGSLRWEVIDWDEPTFLLMAQDVLRGNLPFVEVYDIKPPGMFFLLAGAIEILGQSVVAARVFGCLCFLATGFFTFLIVLRHVPYRHALLAGALLVCAGSIDYGLSTGTEKVAMPFVMLATWLLLEHGRSFAAVFLAGVCISVATLVRTNIAFVVISLGLLLAATPLAPSLRLHRRGLWGYVAGGLIPLAAVIAPYAAAGHLQTLYVSAVEVPLVYAGLQMSSLEVLARMGYHLFFRNFKEVGFLFFLFLPFLGAAGLLGMIRHRATGVQAQLFGPVSSRDLLLLGSVAGSLALSIVFGGVFYSHYLLQLLPFFAVAAAWVLPWRPAKVPEGTPDLVSKQPLVVLVCFAIAALVGLRSFSTIAFGLDSESFPRPVRDAARFLETQHKPGDRILAIGDHLILFYMNEKPLTYLVHPSNVSRSVIYKPLEERGLVPRDEFLHVLRARPKFIINRTMEPPIYLDDTLAGVYEDLIRSHYAVVYSEGTTIFQRIGDPGDPARLRPRP